MSEFHVNVVRVGEIAKHPNADSLSVTKVFDYTVICKTGEFAEGDLAVYIPIDSVVPDTERWHWLLPKNQDGTAKYAVGNVPEKYRVIEAKRLRGIFSQGCLARLPEGIWKEGDDVCTVMGILKYDPPIKLLSTTGECEAAPKGWVFPVYTDIEGLRRYPDILRDGQEVVINEKLHGCNGRFVNDSERLWVGSHTQIKKRDENNLWWRVAIAENLEEKLKRAPMYVFFGEVIGQVQDLTYGIKSGCKLMFFDVFDLKTMRYLDHDLALEKAKLCDIEWVPTLYRGPWSNELNRHANGKSTIADNIREGFVVKPIIEQYDCKIGRVILKRHGEEFLLRKKK